MSFERHFHGKVSFLFFQRRKLYARNCAIWGKKLKVTSLFCHNNNLSQEVMVKVEFTKQPAMKAERGNRGISLLFL